jgi:hypothetical protein
MANEFIIKNGFRSQGNSEITGSINIGGSITAASAIARGGLINTTLTAAANNDVLIGLDINPTFTNGAFTGVSNYLFNMSSPSVSGASIFASKYQYNNGWIINIKNGTTNQTGNIYQEYGLELGSTNTSVAGLLKGKWGVGYNIGTNSVPVTLSVNGSLGVGITTDAGYKLDVNGSTRIKGAGSGSATTSFIVQNSAGSSALTILDDKSAQFGGDVRTNLLTNYYSGNEFYISSQGSNSRINLQSLGNYSDYSIKLSTYYNQSTTGSYNHVVIDGGGDTFYPTGSSVNNLLVISPKINAQGGTNIYRGLYINPAKFNNPQYTDYRAIETVTGNVLLGTTSGNVGIGTTTLNASLDIRGTQTATGSIATTMLISSSLSASANSDTLVGLDINPSFNNGAFTGLDNQSLRITGTSVSATGDSNGIGAAIATFRNNRTSTTFDPVYIVKFNRQNSAVASWYFGNDANNNGVIVTNNSALRMGKDFGGTYTEYLRMFSNGNFLIQNGGTFTDAGYKLDVNGTARVVGQATIQTLTIGLGGGAVASNTALGYQALNANTTAIANVAVGYQAGLNITTGQEMTSIGYLALRNNAAASTAIGSQAMSNATGGQSVAVGANALYSGTGISNTAIGQRSLIATTSGTGNTAIGRQSGGANTTGGNNIFIGNGTDGVSATESNRTWIGNATTATTWLGGSLLIGTTTDVTSSIATLESTTKGFLPPRMTLAQRTAISSPAVGLIVYETGSATTEGIWVNETTGWQQLLTNTGSQNITGSLTVTGSATISNVLTLTPQNPLPSSIPTGSFAVSSSIPPKPYFWDGTTWNALY